MKRTVSAATFNGYSNEKKKKYVVQLLIDDANAKPVDQNYPPVAYVMAGIPGAGKTEFLDSLDERLIELGATSKFVRIDLDQIVTIFPNYTPKTYKKFRDNASVVLARCVDVLRKGRYNIMLDGTFSGTSGASINNVHKLLDSGYLVFMIYMHDDPNTAWKYTQAREAITDRGIDRDDFILSCANISNNVQTAISNFRSNRNFKLFLCQQKTLRDKDYVVLTKDDEIDKIISAGYNIDNLKETL